MPAQGNALGTAPNNEQALKGRDKIMHCTLGSPFQGWRALSHVPRALPWAGLSSHLWCSSAAFAFSPLTHLAGRDARSFPHFFPTRQL